MFDKEKRAIEQVLFLGEGPREKLVANYITHYQSPRGGYNIDFKRSPFGQVETMTGVPIEKIHERELCEINGRITLIVRWFYGSSFDSQVKEYNNLEFLKTKSELETTTSLLEFMTDELQRIPSNIRSTEFTNDRLEQIRVLLGKFQPKQMPGVSVEVGEPVKEKERQK